MNIKIVCVGKLKEKYLKQGIAEYAKRLSKFCKFQIVGVPDEKAPEKLSDAEMEKVKEIEGERILSKIKDKEYVYALAILGKERTSEKFAEEIKDLTTYGTSDITFVIGGSLGLSPPSCSPSCTSRSARTWPALRYSHPRWRASGQ